MKSILLLSTLLITAANAQGFFDHIFRQQQEQHQQPQQVKEGSNRVEATYENDPCDKYLCPDTLVCVSSPKDCPCPFSQQMKCPLPDGNYVCISKPTDSDYDDVNKAPKVKKSGVRDCAFVLNAYKNG